jgi:hypothetical protein
MFYTYIFYIYYLLNESLNKISQQFNQYKQKRITTPLNTQKSQKHMTLEIHDPSWDKHMFDRLSGISNSSGYYIYKDNTDINKQ